MRLYTRQTAIAKGLTRYRGKVCAKHPELKGERGTSGRCVLCNREKNSQYYATPEGKAAYATYQKCYYATPKGKTVKAASDKRYLATPEGKANRVAYQKCYCGTPKGKANHAASAKRCCAYLKPHYVAKLLCIPMALASPELIEAKRRDILDTRFINAVTKVFKQQTLVSLSTERSI